MHDSRDQRRIEGRDSGGGQGDHQRRWPAADSGNPGRLQHPRVRVAKRASGCPRRGHLHRGWRPPGAGAVTVGREIQLCRPARAARHRRRSFARMQAARRFSRQSAHPLWRYAAAPARHDSRTAQPPSIAEGASHGAHGQRRPPVALRAHHSRRIGRDYRYHRRQRSLACRCARFTS